MECLVGAPAVPLSSQSPALESLRVDAFFALSMVSLAVSEGCVVNGGVSWGISEPPAVSEAVSASKSCVLWVSKPPGMKEGGRPDGAQSSA